MLCRLPTIQCHLSADVKCFEELQKDACISGTKQTVTRIQVEVTEKTRPDPHISRFEHNVATLCYAAARFKNNRLDARQCVT